MSKKPMLGPSQTAMMKRLEEGPIIPAKHVEKALLESLHSLGLVVTEPMGGKEGKVRFRLAEKNLKEGQ